MLAAYTPHGHLPEVLGWSCFAETGVHQRPRYLTTGSINFFFFLQSMQIPVKADISLLWTFVEIEKGQE